MVFDRDLHGKWHQVLEDEWEIDTVMREEAETPHDSYDAWMPPVDDV
ncbi:hypothetical protein [Streptomyces sp. NPDC055189]